MAAMTTAPGIAIGMTMAGKIGRAGNARTFTISAGITSGGVTTGNRAAISAVVVIIVALQLAIIV